MRPCAAALALLQTKLQLLQVAVATLLARNRLQEATTNLLRHHKTNYNHRSESIPTSAVLVNLHTQTPSLRRRRRVENPRARRETHHTLMIQEKNRTLDVDCVDLPRAHISLLTASEQRGTMARATLAALFAQHRKHVCKGGVQDSPSIPLMFSHLFIFNLHI